MPRSNIQFSPIPSPRTGPIGFRRNGSNREWSSLGSPRSRAHSFARGCFTFFITALQKIALRSRSELLSHRTWMHCETAVLSGRSTRSELSAAKRFPKHGNSLSAMPVFHLRSSTRELSRMPSSLGLGLFWRKHAIRWIDLQLTIFGGISAHEAAQHGMVWATHPRRIHPPQLDEESRIARSSFRRTSGNRHLQHVVRADAVQRAFPPHR